MCRFFSILPQSIAWPGKNFRRPKLHSTKCINEPACNKQSLQANFSMFHWMCACECMHTTVCYLSVKKRSRKIYGRIKSPSPSSSSSKLLPVLLEVSGTTQTMVAAVLGVVATLRDGLRCSHTLWSNDSGHSRICQSPYVKNSEPKNCLRPLGHRSKWYLGKRQS